MHRQQEIFQGSLIAWEEFIFKYNVIILVEYDLVNFNLGQVERQLAVY